MLTFYEKYRIVIFLVLNLISISIFLYFFINSRKKQWYKYYWKGFLLIFLGGTLITLNQIVSIPIPFKLLRKIITLTLALYGFYLIILGEKLKRTIIKE